MNIYLVGGAVRDQLLSYPVKEKDWVVVGSTPEQLLKQGYHQVGRDFPVFLHPHTKEEYSLARTERKSGVGYYGFECTFDNTITLEQDLQRRDLTINAMAMDDAGNVIDPWKGQQDLNNRILRHVSPAFVEDPVRVLRVARFAARYSHLGFQLADETRLLMYKMVKNGELAHLVPERVWQELQRSLGERNPEIFIKVLRSCDALSIILPEINKLFGVPNTRTYHPEIDSGIHTMMVLQAAVKLSPDPLLRFTALVHDLGKAKTPMKQWPKHRGHDESGVKEIELLCSRLRIPSEYRNQAIVVSRFHILFHQVLQLKATTIVKIFERIDAFRRINRFDNLLIACEADAQGKGKPVDYWQKTLWQKLFKICSDISAADLVNEGFEGEAIKTQLHLRRSNAVKQLLESWKTNEKQQ